MNTNVHLCLLVLLNFWYLTGGGKTSTVSMVMKQLDQDKSDGKLPDFQYAYINAMNIRQIGDIYVEMWRLLNLNKQILTSGKALAYLRMCLSDAPSDVLQRAEIVPHLKNCHVTSTPFVLVFDEIDNVCTNNNRIMYNLFDWPSVGSQNGSTAQLILIGIANIVNLKDRLPNNIQSRLSAPSLYFPSYNASDFISIITNKIEVANNGNVSECVNHYNRTTVQAVLTHYYSQSYLQTQSVLLQGKLLPIQGIFDQCSKCVSLRWKMCTMS